MVRKSTGKPLLLPLVGWRPHTVVIIVYTVKSEYHLYLYQWERNLTRTSPNPRFSPLCEQGTGIRDRIHFHELLGNSAKSLNLYNKI